MKAYNKIKTLIEKYPYTGSLLWVLCIQYFVVTLVVERSWHTTYSFLDNSISDLGNTACGIYSNRLISNSYVCSPRHTLMNMSFILTGILMISGALFTYPLFKKSKANLIGFTCIALGGLGAILVGLFPENTIGGLHTTGAALNFFVGNIGLVILGFGLLIPRWVKAYTLFTGFLALIFLVFYSSKVYLGIGLGGTDLSFSFKVHTQNTQSIAYYLNF
jgi:hypothetical membrane protein